MYEYIQEKTRKGFFLGKIVDNNKKVVFKMLGEWTHKDKIDKVCKVILKKYKMAHLFDSIPSGIPYQSQYCKKWERWLGKNSEFLEKEIPIEEINKHRAHLVMKVANLSKMLNEKVEVQEFKLLPILRDMREQLNKLIGLEQS